MRAAPSVYADAGRGAIVAQCRSMPALQQAALAVNLDQNTMARVTRSSTCRAIVSVVAITASQPLMAAACKAGHTLEVQLKLSAVAPLALSAVPPLAINPSSPPTDDQVRDGEWVTYMAHSDLFVPDGLRHTIVIDAKNRRAWIYEIGGFVDHSAWYGPFPVEPTFEGCTADPKLKSMAGTPPPVNIDLNQQGLTGAWFDPATSGQGILAAVSAHVSTGAGSIFVGWFTYDTVIGGAERQRWYSLQGPMVTGQSNALLTIYQNTGGNFDSPPFTYLEAVGSATLSFDTCASGQLSYYFTDGTGHRGTIPLTRLMHNVTCTANTPYPTNADFALSGAWYEFSTTGQGFVVEVNPNSAAFFLAWYTYMPNGTAAGAAGQRWYSAQGAFMPGMRSVPVTIYETTGAMFDTPTPPGQHTVQVGTGTMTFQSCSAATFSYNFTGGTSSRLSGLITLRRLGPDPVPPGCTS